MVEGRKTESISSLALAAVLAGAATAGAATVCVDSRGAGCQTTIQGAVNLAAAGDTVRIFPGIYFENVTVPAGKDGLRIVGVSPVTSIVDPDVPNSGTGIRIESSRVELAALTIRNGQQHGVSVAGGLEGVTIRGLRFVGGRGPTAILVEPGSTRLRVLANEIRAAGTTGIHLSGGNDHSIVRGNLVRQVDRGIVALGESLDVTSNRLAQTRTYGIQVEGTAAAVVSNVIETAAFVPTAGLEVRGTNPIVRGNRLTSGGTLSVFCTGCSGGVVAQNVSVGAFGSGPNFRSQGIRVHADAAGLVVRGNQVIRASDAAFLIEGTGIRVVENAATDTGTPDAGDGFLISGDGAHTLVRNVATRCGANGFLVNTDNVSLDRNVSLEAGLNGFLVFGAGGANGGNVLTNNRATSANAAGFAITGEASETALTGNRGSDNRYDFCDDGTSTDVSGGNAFGTTSTVCDVTR